MVDGPNHLGYSYDSLGRVLAVVDKNNADRPLKEYVYDTAPGRGAGKLAQATRHNYVTLPWDATETDAWVTDLYDYSGTAGAPSAKTTSFARGPYQYTSAYAYTDGGAIGSVTYPTCDAGFACPATPEPARTVSYTYEQGLLRQVPGWTNTITYHPTGAWSQMPRVNTVTDGRDSDPASPDRLNRFHASSPSTGASWDSGTMAYDGSGNLKSIGADTYTYDQSSRLLSGTAGGERQDYTYDAFGNITQIAHTDAGGATTTRSIGVVPSTNRLSVATYDAAGNLTSWAGNTYTWDALGSLVQFNGGQNGGGTYLYDVEDRRVAVLKSPDNSAAAKDETYILRSLAGQTLREFTVTGIDSPATRAWQKDYLYAAGNLLASVKTDGAGGEDIRHYHRDHLGSPRLITDASGSEVGRRTYLPYGEMVTDTASDESHKYTLHERDENFAGTDDDLDYMLARYYSPHLGRFLSCDPERGRAERLQTLNRYAYAWGNPVKHVDPDGRKPKKGDAKGKTAEPDDRVENGDSGGSGGDDPIDIFSGYIDVVGKFHPLHFSGFFGGSGGLDRELRKRNEQVGGGNKIALLTSIALRVIDREANLFGCVAHKDLNDGARVEWGGLLRDDKRTTDNQPIGHYVGTSGDFQGVTFDAPPTGNLLYVHTHHTGSGVTAGDRELSRRLGGIPVFNISISGNQVGDVTVFLAGDGLPKSGINLGGVPLPVDQGACDSLTGGTGPGDLLGDL